MDLLLELLGPIGLMEDTVNKAWLTSNLLDGGNTDMPG